MSSELENKLVAIERFLTRPETAPDFQIDTAARINSEVCELLKIEDFLNELNEKLFKRKGEVKPLSHRSQIRPRIDELEGEASSRFRRIFSAEFDASSVSSGSELYVPSSVFIKDWFKSGQELEALGIKIYQVVDIDEENFEIFVLGKLYFKVKRRSDGTFEGKQSMLSMMSQGKFLKFSFDSLPSGEAVNENLLHCTEEILRDLEALGYFSLSDDEEKEE